MSTAAGENEVRLRKGTSLNERLVLAGIAVVLCLIALPGLAHLAHEQWLGVAALFALLFGCLLLAAAVLDRNVVWIITAGEILIGEQRPFGKLHRRMIRDDEISGMRLRKSIGKSVEFTLLSTWIGVAVEPTADLVTLRPTPQGFLLDGTPAGLTVSPSSEIGDQLAHAVGLTRQFGNGLLKQPRNLQGGLLHLGDIGQRR